MDPFKAPKKAHGRGRGGGHLMPAPPSAFKPSEPPSGRKQQGLLLTINKLEQESEDRAFELIRLRTLVLRLEKEKEDAQTVCQDLQRENAELKQELTKATTDLNHLKREHNELKCRQWMEGAQGLSTVRTALLGTGPSATSAKPVGDGTAEANHVDEAASPAVFMASDKVIQLLQPPGQPLNAIVEDDGEPGAARTPRTATPPKSEDGATLSGAVARTTSGRNRSSLLSVGGANLTPPMSPAAGMSRPTLPSLQQQQLLQQEASLLAMQLQDFKDRVFYLQQELVEEKKKHESTLATKSQLEDRLVDIMAQARKSSGGGDSLKASGLLRSPSIVPPSPARGSGAAAASAMKGNDAKDQGTKIAGLSPAAEQGLTQLQELVSKMREDGGGLSATKHKELEKECESLRTQLAEAQRVIIEKLAKAPSADDVTELKERLTKLKKANVHKEKQLEEANGRIAQLQQQLLLAAAGMPPNGAAAVSSAATHELEAKAKAAEERAKAAEERLSAADGRLAELRKQVAAAEDAAAKATAAASAAAAATAYGNEQVERAVRAASAKEEKAAEAELMVSALQVESGEVAKQAAALREAEERAAAATERLRNAEDKLTVLERNSGGGAGSGSGSQEALTNALKAAEARAAQAESRLQEVEVLTSALQEQTERYKEAQGRAEVAEQRLAAAETKYAAAEKDAAAKGASLEQLQQQVASLTSQREDALARVKAVEMSSAGAEGKAGELLTQLAEARKQASEAAAATADAERKLAARSAELESKAAEAGAACTARDLAQAVQAKLEKELAAAKEAEAGLQAQLGELRGRAAKLDGAETGLAEATAARNAAQAQVSELKSQLDAAGRKAAALQAQLDESAASHAAQLTAMAQHDGAVADLTARTQELTSKLAAMQAQKDSLAAELTKLQPELEAAGKLLGQREADLASVRHDMEEAKADRDAKGAELASISGQLAAATPSLEAMRAELAEARARAESLSGKLSSGDGQVASLQKELADSQGELARLRKRLDTAESTVSQLSDTMASSDQKMSSLKADSEAKRAELEELNSKNSKMQVLIKDMASQMEVLQGNLAKQTAVVGRLEAALHSQGMAAAEIEDLHKSQSVQLRERAEDAERKLTTTRMKLNAQSKEVARLSNGSAPTLASNKGEVQALFKKLRNIAQAYRLQLASSLVKQLRSEGSNVTELQLFQMIHAVLAALEASSGGTSPGSPHASHAREDAPGGLPPSRGGLAPLSPLPATYDMRAALAGASFMSTSSSAAGSPHGGGGGAIGRTSSSGGLRPGSSSNAPRVGSSGGQGYDNGYAYGGGIRSSGGHHGGHGGGDNEVSTSRASRLSEAADGMPLRSMTRNRMATDTSAVGVMHSRGASMADSILEDHANDPSSSSADTLPELPRSKPASPHYGSRPGSANSRPGSAKRGASQRVSDMGNPLTGIPQVPSHLPKLVGRPSQSAIALD